MYIQSKHRYEVAFGDVTIPKANYTEHEMKYGKRAYIEVSNEELELLKTDKIFQALVTSKQYVISDTLPSGLMSFDDLAKLREATLTKVINDKDAVISEKDKEIAALKKELAKKEKPAESKKEKAAK
jgi:hypothetical protein